MVVAASAALQPRPTPCGYNPQKPGRVSHHPLLAFIADTQMVANLWLRPGNTHSANNVLSFFNATLQRLGDKRVELVRADSGFSEAAFLAELEAKQTHYIVALRLQQPLQRALVAQSGWWPLEEPGAQGIEIASFDYHCGAWDAPRRIPHPAQSQRGWNHRCHSPAHQAAQPRAR